MKIENEKEKEIAAEISNQKGQTFLEFIFLILIIVSTTFTLLTGLRSVIGTRWEVMIKIIASPNSNDVSLP